MYPGGSSIASIADKRPCRESALWRRATLRPRKSGAGRKWSRSGVGIAWSSLRPCDARNSGARAYYLDGCETIIAATDRATPRDKVVGPIGATKDVRTCITA
jgi:hypothetical protein